MTSERGDRVWLAWKDSTEKFDHLMAGVCTAVTAYVWQQVEVSYLGWNPETLELAAVVLLGGSAYFAFKRISTMVAAVAAIHVQTASQEGRGNIHDALLKFRPGGVLLNTSTGDSYSQEDAVNRGEHLRQLARTAESEAKAWDRRGRREYKARQYLLYAGFFLLLAARVWEAAAG